MTLCHYKIRYFSYVKSPNNIKRNNVVRLNLSCCNVELVAESDNDVLVRIYTDQMIKCAVRRLVDREM